MVISQDHTPLRPHAEQAFGELAALRAADDRPRPPRWRLSPWAVVTYLMGGTLSDGTEISAKYVGSRRLMEVAVATLATDRALLLLGVPGTAKSWVSEHLAAAVSGRFHAAGPGHLRYAGGGHPLRLELRQAAGRGAHRAGSGALAGDDGDEDRRPGPDRGADPDPQRRPGRADHRAVGEDAADTRARPGGPGASRASTSSPPPTTATAA